MMSCKQATALISQGQERPLKLSERLSIKLHVSMCGGCRNFEKQMTSLRDLSQQFARGEQSSQDGKL